MPHTHTAMEAMECISFSFKHVKRNSNSISFFQLLTFSLSLSVSIRPIENNSWFAASCNIYSTRVYITRIQYLLLLAWLNVVDSFWCCMPRSQPNQAHHDICSCSVFIMCVGSSWLCSNSSLCNSIDPHTMASMLFFQTIPKHSLYSLRTKIPLWKATATAAMT